MLMAIGKHFRPEKTDTKNDYFKESILLKYNKNDVISCIIRMYNLDNLDEKRRWYPTDYTYNAPDEFMQRIRQKLKNRYEKKDRQRRNGATRRPERVKNFWAGHLSP